METHFPNLDDTPSRIARERVLADMQTLARDTEELLSATAGDLSDKAKSARSRVAAALERAKATCSDLQQQGLDKAKAAMKTADTTIRTHPYESIGIAFGVGVLLGVLIRQK